MSRLFESLLKLFLLDKVFMWLWNGYKRTQAQVAKIKPFSWEVLLLLSLFSWCIFLLIQSPAIRQFISIFAWVFLILGVDWALMTTEITIGKGRDGKDKKMKLDQVNFLGVKFRSGPWITGALICAALLSNRFLLTTFRDALISWPLISAAVAAHPRLLKKGPKYQLPAKDDRQDLVLLILTASLLSCWFTFHFLVQDWLKIYPSLQADSFDRSLFVNQFGDNDRPETYKGDVLLDAAEATVRSEWRDRSWVDIQRWLQNAQAEVAQLESRIINATFQGEAASEAQFWRLTAFSTPGIPDNRLQFLANWVGPSSQSGGYTLAKTCRVRQAPAVAIQPGSGNAGSGTPGEITSYQMECRREQPPPFIRSEEPPADEGDRWNIPFISQ